MLHSYASSRFLPQRLGWLPKTQTSRFACLHSKSDQQGSGLSSDYRVWPAHVVARLTEEGVRIENVYVCPHGRTDGCACIKPQPHFLKEAAARHQIDMRESFVIGDHPHDVLLARNAGAFGICVLTGHGAKHFGELPKSTLVVTGIREAAAHILKRAKVFGRHTTSKRAYARIPEAIGPKYIQPPT